MASCCGECQDTKAILIDDGPEICSLRFFTGSNSKSYTGYNDVKRFFDED